MQNNVYYISTEIIVPNLYQPRKFFNEEAIEELAQSIKAYGIIQPLTVRMMGEGNYELVAGERRLRAAKKAGLLEVPVIVMDLPESDSAAIALLENLQREDLNYIEEAEAYANLIKDHGYTQEQLAEVIGKKQSTIANKMRLLKLSKEIREKLLENNLTERHARALLTLPTEELQMKVLKIIIKKKLNVKEAEHIINLELLRLQGETSEEVAADGKKKIKGIFNSKVYVNTIKQVFDKFKIDAKYDAKETDDYLQVTIKIPKVKK